MITLTDDEQATALRAARYALGAMVTQNNNAMADPKKADARAANIAKLERVAAVLERKNDNGMWRCLCPNPWRHPDCLVCSTCGAAVALGKPLGATF